LRLDDVAHRVNQRFQEKQMQVKQWIALSAVALATGAAMADQPTDAVTRAQVAQDVISARAAGQLRPAGEAAEYSAPSSQTSSLTRAEVQREVLAARTSGELEAAGEASDFPRSMLAQNASTSTLTRAEVKAQTLEARAAGELMPAGEAVDGAEPQHMARIAVHGAPQVASSARFRAGE
jgi:hypothetical protein